MFLVLALGLSACGKKDTAVPADAPAEEVTQEAAASEETPADTTEEAEKTGELPTYKYTGEDPLYAEIDRYVVEEIGSDYAEGQVGIPCNIIIEIDESDDDDIKDAAQRIGPAGDLNGVENFAAKALKGLLARGFTHEIPPAFLR